MQGGAEAGGGWRRTWEATVGRDVSRRARAAANTCGGMWAPATAGKLQGVSEKYPALSNSTKKQRLLRCLTLQYIKHCSGFMLCIRTFLAFGAFDLSDTPREKWKMTFIGAR